MPRKPKGWYHRYEITWKPVRFHPRDDPKDWWVVVHYYGRNQGAGARNLDNNPGIDADDDYLIRLAGADSVTVPVYVVRGEQVNGPYFGEVLRPRVKESDKW